MVYYVFLFPKEREQSLSQKYLTGHSFVKFCSPVHSASAGWGSYVQLREKGLLSLGFVGVLVYCQAKSGQDVFHYVGSPSTVVDITGLISASHPNGNICKNNPLREKSRTNLLVDIPTNFNFLKRRETLSSEFLPKQEKNQR